jgi:hypothetical protein
MFRQAILVQENDDPIWRHVRVPEAFLSPMCLNAESILDKIDGKQYLTVVVGIKLALFIQSTKKLTGASNYWQMVT